MEKLLGHCLVIRGRNDVVGYETVVLANCDTLGFDSGQGNQGMVEWSRSGVAWVVAGDAGESGLVGCSVERYENDGDAAGMRDDGVTGFVDRYLDARRDSHGAGP